MRELKKQGAFDMLMQREKSGLIFGKKFTEKVLQIGGLSSIIVVAAICAHKSGIFSAPGGTLLVRCFI